MIFIMKETYPSFAETSKQEMSADTKLSIDASNLLERYIKERKDEFKALHGSMPTALELKKILRGVRGRLEIDLREGDTPASPEVIEKALEFLPKDIEGNAIKAFFETHERRREPRN